MTVALKIRRDPAGDTTLSEDRIAQGILWIGISSIPGFFGVLLLRSFLGKWVRGEQPLGSAEPEAIAILLLAILALVALPLLGILRGLHVALSRTRLVFKRARQELVVQMKRPGRIDEESFPYAEVRLEVMPAVIRNPRGPDWVGYEASIRYPSGSLMVARNAALSRIEAFVEELCRRTGLLRPALDALRSHAPPEVGPVRRVLQTAGILVLFLLLFAACFFCIGIRAVYPVLDPWKLGAFSLLGSLPLMAVGLWVLRYRLRWKFGDKGHLSSLAYLFVVIGIPSAGIGTLHAINADWDPSPAVSHIVRVVEIRTRTPWWAWLVGRKVKAQDYLVVESWRPPGGEEEIWDDGEMSGPAEPGSTTLRVVTRGGAFGFEWVVARDLEGQPVPWLVSHFLNRGFEHYEHENYDMAIAEYEMAIAEDPRDGLPHYYLGMVHIKQENYEPAYAALKKATELDPKYAPAQEQLASLSGRTGRYDEGIEALTRLLEIGGDKGRAYYQRSWMHWKKEDKEATMADIEKACRLHYEDACSRREELKAIW